MRIIHYKKVYESPYERYVDIGCNYRNIYDIPFYDKQKLDDKNYYKNYNEWLDKFKKESLASQMVTFYFYLSEYLGWGDIENESQIDDLKKNFKAEYGEETFNVLESNLNLLLSLHEKWFEYHTSVFKGIDLGWEDNDDMYIVVEEDEDGVKKVIELYDGSFISFLDDDDSVAAFYVPENEYLELRKEVDKIIAKFEV